MDDTRSLLRELGMSDSEDELAVLAQLQQYINDGSFTTETFLSGKFQDTLREAKLILVEDPHGGSHRWHHMSVRDSKQKEGYESQSRHWQPQLSSITRTSSEGANY